MKNMTPKEKAVELVDKYRTYIRIADKYDYNVSEDEIHISKQCALIAVDEIIKSREDDGHFDDSVSYTGSEYYTEHPMYLTFWLQVKQEIEKL
jgi:hypothetical protein